eukprot:2602351-Amphidinium_carterae.1
MARNPKTARNHSQLVISCGCKGRRAVMELLLILDKAVGKRSPVEAASLRILTGLTAAALRR